MVLGYPLQYQFRRCKSSRPDCPDYPDNGEFCRCGLVGIIWWLPTERACVNARIASWISWEGCYQVLSRWNDSVIYFSWQHIRRGQVRRWCYLLGTMMMATVGTSVRQCADIFLDIVWILLPSLLHWNNGVIYYSWQHIHQGLNEMMYTLCGLVGIIWWLPTERACVNGQIPS